MLTKQSNIPLTFQYLGEILKLKLVDPAHVNLGNGTSQAGYLIFFSWLK